MTVETTIIHWLTGKACDAILGSFRKSDVNTCLDRWRKRVEAAGYSIYAESINPIDSHDYDAPCAQRLCEVLNNNDLPSIDIFHAALLERWEALTIKGQNLTSFYQADKKEIRPYLLELATELRDCHFINNEETRRKLQLKQIDGTDELKELLQKNVTSDDLKNELNASEKRIIETLRHDHVNQELHTQELNEVLLEKYRLEESLSKRITALKNHITELQDFRDRVPSSSEAFLNVQHDLSKGDYCSADKALMGVEIASEQVIESTAYAAYLRGDIAEKTFHYMQADEHYAKAIRLNPNNSAYLIAHGELMKKLNRFDQAREDLASALILDLADDKPLEAMVNLYLLLGNAEYRLQKYKDAENHFNSALNCLSTAEADQILIAKVKYHKGLIALTAPHYDKANILLREALTVLESNLGMSNPDVAEILSMLGVIAARTDGYIQARPLYERALASSRAYYGDFHPVIAIRLNGVGTACDEPSDAKRFYQQALDMDTKIFGNDHPAIALRLANLATIDRFFEDYQAAEEKLRESLRINLLYFNENHPEVFQTYAALGWLCFDQELYEECFNNWRKSLIGAIATYGRHHAGTATQHVNMAQVLWETDPHKARLHIKTAYKIYCKTLGESHIDTQETRDLLDEYMP